MRDTFIIASHKVSIFPLFSDNLPFSDNLQLALLLVGRPINGRVEAHIGSCSMVGWYVRMTGGKREMVYQESCTNSDPNIY